MGLEILRPPEFILSEIEGADSEWHPPCHPEESRYNWGDEGSQCQQEILFLRNLMLLETI